jgi:hypothetical protein
VIFHHPESRPPQLSSLIALLKFLDERSDRCTRHSTGCSLVHRAKGIQWIPGEILSAMRQLEGARCDPGFHDNYRTKQSRASNSPRHFNHSEAAARCRCRQHSIKRGSLCPTEWLMRASRSNQPVGSFIRVCSRRPHPSTLSPPLPPSLPEGQYGRTAQQPHAGDVRHAVLRALVANWHVLRPIPVRAVHNSSKSDPVPNKSRSRL